MEDWKIEIENLSRKKAGLAVQNVNDHIAEIVGIHKNNVSAFFKGKNEQRLGLYLKMKEAIVKLTEHNQIIPREMGLTDKPILLKALPLVPVNLTEQDFQKFHPNPEVSNVSVITESGTHEIVLDPAAKPGDKVTVLHDGKGGFSAKIVPPCGCYMDGPLMKRVKFSKCKLSKSEHNF